jgi:hypothetical protein
VLAFAIAYSMMVGIRFPAAVPSLICFQSERARPAPQPAPVAQRKDPGQAAKTAGSAALARFEVKTAPKPKVCSASVAHVHCSRVPTLPSLICMSCRAMPYAGACPYRSRSRRRRSATKVRRQGGDQALHVCDVSGRFRARGDCTLMPLPCCLSVRSICFKVPAQTLSLQVEAANLYAYICCDNDGLLYRCAVGAGETAQHVARYSTSYAVGMPAETYGLFW